MYEISGYSYKKARKLNVEIFSATNPAKKIDVYKDGYKVATIGDIDYYDYPSYLKLYGKDVANEHKRLYHIRHKNDTGLAGYYSKELLW